MSGSEYDVIVVGAGVEGSSTAYNLVKNGGGRVLLLEQFSALHTRGSSHGGSRITRRAYTKSFYILMMDEAYKMWSEIEKESGCQLFLRAGLLMFGPKNSKYLQKGIKCVSQSGIPHEVLSAEETMYRYPRQLNLPLDHFAIYEKEGGILLAHKAVGTMQKLFVKFGGVLLDHHRVTEIIPGDTVTVKTDKGDFTSKKIVITAGAWAPKIMKKLGVQLPFKVTRTEVLYWKVDNPENFAWTNFPAFICYTDHENPYYHMYGIPILEYPGLIKICFHSGDPVDPDNRDAHPGPSTTKYVLPFITKYFKGVATTPSIYEACMYTESPDENPVLDRHPVHSNIVFGAGFSGHGFKLSPVIGKILTELVLDLPPSYELSPFKLNRFSLQKSNL